ncbi:MAG: Cof-type HAD-IIB family hydrolase [Phycisphaerales bacterium]|nr:Cof-type HAD-IIB family hydrolase [Phycisphaerales bacterium]
MALHYDILALDLDGTLLGPDGTVSPGNRAAVQRAREAGLAIFPCTGRGLVECRHILEDIGHVGPVAVAGGAMIADVASGRTLHRFAMSPSTVAHAVEAFHEEGNAALVLKDRYAAGFDYLVVTGPDHHEIDPVSVWWFEALKVELKFVQSLEQDAHPEYTIRASIVADAHRSVPLMRRLRDHFGPSALLHSFPAVISSDLQNAGGREVHVLEVFDARAHKWSAVQWFAEQNALFNPRVCALGDHVNDVTMLREAALGIAMGNAAPEARAVADIITRSNADDGVAYAIDQILAGAW